MMNKPRVPSLHQQQLMKLVSLLGNAMINV
jgi:hypothetical protein